MQALGFLLELAPDCRLGLEQTEVVRATPAHPDARLLLDFWRSRDRVLVMGRELPCRQIARILPNIAIFEYRQVRSDFRVRLAGFGLIRLFGRDISHSYLAEILSGDELAQLHRHLMNARGGKSPIIRQVTIRNAFRPVLRFEMVLLRVLAADGVTPLVLAGSFFEVREPDTEKSRLY